MLGLGYKIIYSSVSSLKLLEQTLAVAGYIFLLQGRHARTPILISIFWIYKSNTATSLSIDWTVTIFTIEQTFLGKSIPSCKALGHCPCPMMFNFVIGPLCLWTHLHPVAFRPLGNSTTSHLILLNSMRSFLLPFSNYLHHSFQWLPWINLVFHSWLLKLQACLDLHNPRIFLVDNLPL